jgi:tetratricopeptide (TPR) repeat protein
MPIRHSYDVFCSYAHVDADAVERLVEALEGYGLSVYFDRAAIVDFESITRSIERGLARSRTLLAYYSTKYPTRRACQWELTAAFLAAQREGDPRRRVLVVNPEEGSDHIEPVELRDALFRAAPTPGDNDGHAALARTVAEHVVGLEGLLGEVGPVTPPAWHPDQRPGSDRFVGRLAEMWEMHSALQASGLGLITGAVSAVAQLRGLGGVGKSLLAEEYALRFGAAYPGGVFWLRGLGDGEGSLDGAAREAERQRQFEGFAVRLDIQVVDPDPERVRGALTRWFAEQSGACLWVVDDLAAGLGGELGRWLAPHPAVKTLITTRSREYNALGHRTDLAELSEAEAVELLTKRRRPRNDHETTAGRVIAAHVGYHPLALDVAAGALQYQTYMAFLDALTEPSEDWLELLTAELRDSLPNGHERSIARTLSRSIDRLGHEALDFLRLASVLAAAPLSADLVSSVFAAIDGLDELAATSRQAKAVDETESVSLAEATGELAWRVHALVLRTMRFRDQNPHRRERLRQAAIDVLGGALIVITDPSAETQTLGALAHARELTQQPRDPSELALLSLVAGYDFGRGDYQSARTLYERQLEGSAQTFVKYHPFVLATLNNLANTHMLLGDLTRARQLQEEVLSGCREAFGEEHSRTLTVQSNLANTLRAQGNVDGACQLHEEVLAVRHRLLGDEHPETLSTQNSLAAMLRTRGDLAAARRLQERVLDARTRVLGEEHSDTLTTQNNLAETLKAQGDLDGARQLHEHVLGISRRRLGEEHPDTLTTKNNLAATLHALGDCAQARKLFKDVLDARRRLLGDEHPDTLTAKNNLGETLRSQGDAAGARKLHEEVFNTSRRVVGEEHPDTMTALNNLAVTHWTLGDFSTAHRLLTRLVEQSRRVLGEDHPDTLTALNNLAKTLQFLGDLPGARRLQEQVVADCQRVLGEAHPYTRVALKCLAEIREGEGD